jgi:hypothetical protein
MGDRVLVPNGATLGTGAARQVVVMARTAIASRREQERDDWRRRGINGRVVAIDAAKQEISVETRGREGAPETLVVATGAGVRFKRYAPGSLRPADAVAGSFSEIRVGDVVRVLGERDAAAPRVKAEEVISGSVARIAGTVERVDAARNEVVIRSGQNNQLITVALVQNTTLRRIPAEFAERLNQRQQRRERRGAAGGGQGNNEERREERRAERAERRNQNGQGGEQRGNQEGQGQGGPRRGGGFQQMFESMPAITVAELKKGDAVIVMGTTGADATRLTAATLLTGDAQIVQRMQNLQGGPGGRREMSPGLPGDAIGGGPGSRDNRDAPSPPRQ